MDIFYEFSRVVSNKSKTSDKTILYFGRIWGYKGLKYLFQSEPMISEVIPNLKIIIAGYGENIEKYEPFIVNKEKYEFINEFIPNGMVLNLFERSDVVVLPYIEASQSGVIPLAYYTKKPVVVTNVGSLPEVVDHGVTGLIIPPKNIEYLSKAIIDLLSNETKLRYMGENGYKKLTNELNWDIAASTTHRIYNVSLKNKIK